MPPRNRTDDWPCPIARTADLVGDAWTVLIMRDLFTGIRRFGDLQRSLDAPRSVLSARLQKLVDDGMLRKVPYQERPVRYEYRLTDKGRSFWDVLAAMFRWGDDWLFDDAAPVMLADAEDGHEVRPLIVDEETGEHLDVRSIRVTGRPR